MYREDSMTSFHSVLLCVSLARGQCLSDLATEARVHTGVFTGGGHNLSLGVTKTLALGARWLSSESQSHIFHPIPR